METQTLCNALTRTSFSYQSRRSPARAPDDSWRCCPGWGRSWAGRRPRSPPASSSPSHRPAGRASLTWEHSKCWNGSFIFVVLKCYWASVLYPPLINCANKCAGYWEGIQPPLWQIVNKSLNRVVKGTVREKNIIENNKLGCLWFHIWKQLLLLKYCIPQTPGQGILWLNTSKEEITSKYKYIVFYIVEV